MYLNVYSCWRHTYPNILEISCFALLYCTSVVKYIITDSMKIIIFYLCIRHTMEYKETKNAVIWMKEFFHILHKQNVQKIKNCENDLFVKL